MPKTKAERGARAAFVREGLQRHPGLMPKALADKLNDEAKEKGLKIGEIKGQHISQMKLQLREAAAKATQQNTAQSSTPPTAAVDQKPSEGTAPQPTPTNSATVTIQDFRALKNLADRLGKDRVRELLDLLG